jgi:hypothetical protein
MRKHQEEKGVVCKSPFAGAVAASHGGWLFGVIPLYVIILTIHKGVVKSFLKIFYKK